MLASPQSDVGNPLFEVWGKGRMIILNRAVTDQSHSDITGLHIYICFSNGFHLQKFLHRMFYNAVKPSKGRQFTGSARRVGVRHLDSVYMHTPYQFYRSIAPHSTNRRHISWFKSQPQPKGLKEHPDNEEDAARIAILNKVMKGRQPTDLILRCKWNPSSPFSVR